MLKEAADNALSLDGTSFMSRILKVLISAWCFSICLDKQGNKPEFTNAILLLLLQHNFGT
jgi:hypothetical protein